MASRSRNPDAVAAGVRLRAVRIALGYEKLRRFAQVTDVPETNLTKWENGAALVPPSYIDQLRQQFGITHDWIYGAVQRGLPQEVVIKLVGNGGLAKPKE